MRQSQPPDGRLLARVSNTVVGEVTHKPARELLQRRIRVQRRRKVVTDTGENLQVLTRSLRNAARVLRFAIQLCGINGKRSPTADFLREPQVRRVVGPLRLGRQS